MAIHESAGARAATEWWAQRLGLDAAWFQRPTLERNEPKTTRYNTGDDYHGCLSINVPRSRALYWRIEGIMAALAEPHSAEGG